nr:hypothetical protein GCM10020093_111650 [Planobispora longispora]
MELHRPGALAQPVRLVGVGVPGGQRDRALGQPGHGVTVVLHRDDGLRAVQQAVEERVAVRGGERDDPAHPDLQPVAAALDAPAAGERHQLGAQADPQGRHAAVHRAAEQVAGGGQPG